MTMVSMLVSAGLVLKFGEASQVAADSRPSFIVIGVCDDVCGADDIVFSVIITLDWLMLKKMITDFDITMIFYHTALL